MNIIEKEVEVTPEQRQKIDGLTVLVSAYTKAGEYESAVRVAKERHELQKGKFCDATLTDLLTCEELVALRTTALENGSERWLHTFANATGRPIEESEVVACIRTNIDRSAMLPTVNSVVCYLRNACFLLEHEADLLACRQEQLMQEYSTNRSYVEGLIEYSSLLSSVTEVGRDALVRTVGWYVERCLPEWESAREQRLDECSSEREKLVYAVGLVRAYGAPADTIDKLITFAFRVSRPREEMDATALAWRLRIDDHACSVLHHVTKVVFRLSRTSRVAFVRACIARGYWKDWWLFRREWQLPEEVVADLVSIHVQIADEKAARGVAQNLRDGGHGCLTPLETSQLAEAIVQRRK